MFTVTPKTFAKFFVYLAGCGGEIVAVDNQRYFVTPINRRDFLNKTSCEWNISTKSKNEVVVLSLSVAEIEEQNYLAARTSSANIPNGRNLTTIMIQVSMDKLYIRFMQITLIVKFESFLFLENTINFCCVYLPPLHHI